MEKEKPYKCDVCGKRYKNLNGLKYVSVLARYSGASADVFVSIVSTRLLATPT